MPNKNKCKCGSFGVVEDTTANTAIIECISCFRKWEVEQEICSSCKKPNGYAVEGVCKNCYSGIKGGFICETNASKNS